MRCNVAFLSGLPTPTCRKPYIYISGDVPVPIARYTSITNIDTCADHCESKSNCCSFEFRQKERKCNINMECKPTGPVHVQVHDQIFCGKHFVIIWFRLKFNLDLVRTPQFGKSLFLTLSVKQGVSVSAQNRTSTRLVIFPAMVRLKPTFQSPTLAPAPSIATTIRSAAALSSVKEGEDVISTGNANQHKLCSKIKSSAVKVPFEMSAFIFEDLVISVDCKLGEWTSWSKSCSCDSRFSSRSKNSFYPPSLIKVEKLEGQPKNLPGSARAG